MAWFKSFRAFALSALLAAGCTSSAVRQEVALTPMQLADKLVAEALERPAAPATSAFDLDALNALLGGAVIVTAETSAADAASGAWRLGTVKAELAGETPVTLFTADEVLLWNADIDGLSARIAGENLDTELKLFDRIEFGGVTLDLTDYTNAVDDAVNAVLEDGNLTPADAVYEEATMKVGRLVLEGLTLYPWTFEENEDGDEGLEAVRFLSAVARNFSLDSLLMTDVRNDQKFHESDATAVISAVYDHSLLQGYHRGDIAMNFQTGMSFSGSIPVPTPSTPPVSEDVLEGGEETAPAMPAPTVPFDFSGSMNYAAWNGLSFSRLLEWGERGEIPPITEKDLWSLGTYVIDDMNIDLGGKPMMRIGSFEMAADEFAWFFPKRLVVEHEDVSFHLSDLLRTVAALEPEASLPSDEPSPAEIADLLDRTGFGTLSGDGILSLTWNEDTGETLLESTSIADGLYADDLRFAVTLPGYAALVPAFGIDGRSPDTEMMGNLFESAFAFHGAHYSLTDAGILDGAASLVIEFAKMMPPPGEGESSDADMLAGFADSTPETLRGFAATMLLFTGGAVTQEIPGAEGWTASLASFISSGGTLTIASAPEAPVTAASLAPPEDTGMAESSLDFVKLFGITVVHTPPPEAADEGAAE